MLDPVQYELRFQQAPHADFDVRRVHIHEALGEPYRLEVEAIAIDADADPEAWLGASAEFVLRRGETARSVYGIVESIEDRDATQPRFTFSVVPAFALLAKETTHAIFQAMSVPQVLEAVLAPALARYDRTLKLDLRATYDPRDYCVCFAESILDFCERLIAEEGIVYAFEMTDGAEVMVLRDHAEADPEVWDGEPVPFFAHLDAQSLEEGLVTLAWRRGLTVNAVECTTHNWKGPEFAAYAECVTEPHVHQDRRTLLAAPRRITTDGAENPSFTGVGTPNAEHWAKRGLQAHRVRRRQAEGTSNITALAPGLRMLTDTHTNRNLDDVCVLITAVTHHGESSGAGSEETSVGTHYRNTFKAIVAGQTFIPASPSLKPRVHGVQLATVVGPRDQEIHTDPMGRIRVRFHWDRQSPAEELASCWIRVAQSLAGPGYGAVFIPRVGMEVLVQFLDGDPDQPLVCGTVYNGAAPPPYTLPEDRARSGWVSRSTPGGNGHHELRFDDTADHEELFVRAQHQMRVAVHGQETRTVSGDHSSKIHGERTTTIHKHDTTTVDGVYGISVRGEHSQTRPTGDVRGALLEILKGDYHVQVDDGRIEAVASSEILLECGESRLRMTPSAIELTSPQVTLTAYAVRGPATACLTRLDLTNAAATLEADKVEHASANASVTLQGGTVTARGGCTKGRSAPASELELESNAKCTTRGDVTLSCKNFNAGANGRIELSSFESTTISSTNLLECTACTTQVRGTTTTIAGTPIHLNPPGPSEVA